MDSISEGIIGKEAPTHVSWYISLAGITSVNEMFSTGTLKKIRRGQRLLEEQGFQIKIEEVTLEKVEIFYEHYRINIEGKANPRVVDIPKWWERRVEEGVEYLLISLKKGKEFYGGIIFRSAPDLVSTAYKVFPNALPDISLPISPTMLAEYELFAYAVTEEKKKIIHGKDRNMYGEYSGIGLAMFKTQLGASPKVPVVATTHTMGEDWYWDGGKDVLVFLGKEAGTHCTTAVLYTTLSDEEARNKYAALWKTDAYQVVIKHT